MTVEKLSLDPSLVWPQLRTIIIDGRIESDLEDSGSVFTTKVLARLRQKIPEVILESSKDCSPLTEWSEAHQISCKLCYE